MVLKLNCDIAYNFGWLKRVNILTVRNNGIVLKAEDRVVPSLSLLDIVLTPDNHSDVRIFAISKAFSPAKNVLMSLMYSVMTISYEEYLVALQGALPAFSEKAWASMSGQGFIPLVEGSVKSDTLVIFARGEFLEQLVGAKIGTPEFYKRVQEWKKYGSPGMTPANGVFVGDSKQLRVGIIPESEMCHPGLLAKGIEAQTNDGDMFINGVKVDIHVKKYSKDNTTKYEPLRTAQFRYRQADKDLSVYEVWKGVIRNCPQWKFIQMCEQYGFDHTDVDMLSSEGNLKASNLKGKRIQVIESKYLGLLNVNDSGPCTIGRQPITGVCLAPEYQAPMFDMYEFVRQQGVKYDKLDGSPVENRLSTRILFDAINGDLVAMANLLNMKQADGFEDIISTMMKLTLFPVKGVDGVWRSAAYRSARNTLAPKIVGSIRRDILSVSQKNPTAAKLSSLYASDLEAFKSKHYADTGEKMIPIVLTHKQGKAYVAHYEKHGELARNCMLTYPCAGAPNMTEIAPVAIGKDGFFVKWELGMKMFTDDFMNIPVSQLYAMIKDCDGDIANLYLFVSEHHFPVTKVYPITKATKADKPKCDTMEELYHLLLMAEFVSETGIGLADSAIAVCATNAIVAGKSLPYKSIVKLQEILELVIKAEQRGKVSGKTIPEFVMDVYSIAGFSMMPYKNAILNFCFGSFGLKGDDETFGTVAMVRSWLDQSHKAVPLCAKVRKQGGLFPYEKLINEVSSRGIKEMRLIESDSSSIGDRLRQVLDHFQTLPDPNDQFHPRLVKACMDAVSGVSGINSKYSDGIKQIVRMAEQSVVTNPDGSTTVVPPVINNLEKQERMAQVLKDVQTDTSVFVWKMVMKDAPMVQEPTSEEQRKLTKVMRCLALCSGVEGFTKTKFGKERAGGAFFSAFSPEIMLWISYRYYSKNPVLAYVTKSIQDALTSIS